MPSTSARDRFQRSQSYFDSGNGVPRNAIKPGQPALGELYKKHCLRYDTIGEFNVDWKAEYSALSSTRSQKKKLKQPTPVPL